MPTRVNVEGVGIVNFPDDFTEAQIKAAIQKDILPKIAASSPSMAGRVADIAGQAWDIAGQAWDVANTPAGGGVFSRGVESALQIARGVSSAVGPALESAYDVVANPLLGTAAAQITKAEGLAGLENLKTVGKVTAETVGGIADSMLSPVGMLATIGTVGAGPFIKAAVGAGFSAMMYRPTVEAIERARKEPTTENISRATASATMMGLPLAHVYGPKIKEALKRKDRGGPPPPVAEEPIQQAEPEVPVVPRPVTPAPEPAAPRAAEAPPLPTVREAAQGLPRDLAGAKPRYSFGNKQFELEFASDIDRAAYITAQAKPSKRDADYVKFVQDQTGLSEGDVRALGRGIRIRIKENARTAEPGVLRVEPIYRPSVPRAAEPVVAQDPAPLTNSQRVARAEMARDPNARDAMGVLYRDRNPEIAPEPPRPATVGDAVPKGIPRVEEYGMESFGDWVNQFHPERASEPLPKLMFDRALRKEYDAVLDQYDASMAGAVKAGPPPQEAPRGNQPIEPAEAGKPAAPARTARVEDIAEVLPERLRVEPAPATVKPDAAPKLDTGRTGEGPPVLAPRPLKGTAATGRDTTVLIPGQADKFEAKYAVRELEDVYSSHNGLTFQANPEYQARNERNYSDPANQERVTVNSLPDRFDPRYLVTDNPDVTNGPPVIDPQGNVLGGNSRAMILQRVHEGNPTGAAAMKQALEESASMFGIDPTAVRSMRRPVLVREMSEDALAAIAGGRQTVVRATNKTGTAELTPTERATSDAAALSSDMASYIGWHIEQAGEGATLNDILSGGKGTEILNRLTDEGVFTMQEKPKLVNASTGALTADAKQRISKMLLGRLFRDGDQMQRTPASITNKLERLVAPLSQLQEKAEWDLTPAVKEAIDVLEYSRAHEIKNLSDLTAQASLFGDAPQFSEKAVALAGVIRDRKPNDIVKQIRLYTSDSTPSMFRDVGQEQAFAEAFGGKQAQTEGVTLGSGLGALQHLDAAGKEASQRLRDQGLFSGEKLSAQEFLNPATIRDLALSIAGDVARGVLTVEQLAVKYGKQFGPRAREIAETVYSEARRLIATPAEIEQFISSKRPGLTVSPSYDKTKQKILEHVEASDATKNTLGAAMAEWEARNPQRQVRTSEQIKAEAREQNPGLLKYLDLGKAQDAVRTNDALHFAAKEHLNQLADQAVVKQRELAEKATTLTEDQRIEAQREIDGLESDMNGLQDILLPVRSQDGRNLRNHSMMAQVGGFDTVYWTARAKRAMGLDVTKDLPVDTQKEIQGILFEGREAERMAEEKVRSTRQPGRPAPPKQRTREQEVEATKKRLAASLRSFLKDGATAVKPEERLLFESDPVIQELRAEVAKRKAEIAAVPLTREHLIEKYTQRILASLESKIQGNVKPVDPRALTAAERQAVANDLRVLAKRRELAEKFMHLEKDGVLSTINQLLKTNILTGLKTHGRNLGGNTVSMMAEEIARVPAVVFDWGMSSAKGWRTVEGPNPAAVTKAVHEAGTRGIKEAYEVMKKGATSSELAKFDITKEHNSGSQILNTYINFVRRTTSAGDRPFRVYAYERTLAERMRLAGVDKPTEAMRLESIADAETLTFNNRTILADVWGVAKKYAENRGPVGKTFAFGMDRIVPFPRTPSAIIQRVLDYSGVGIPKAYARLIKTTIDKKFTPADQRYIAQNMGRATVGLSIISLGYLMAKNGLATGTYQENPSARNVDDAADRPPAAVMLGDRWYTVPFSPIGNLFSIGATLWRESTRPLNEEAKRPWNIAKIGVETVLDQPMLQGASDFFEAMKSPEGKGERLLGSMAGTAVPTIINDLGTATDSARRDTRADSTLGAIAKGVAGRLPGVRNLLPQRTDVLGTKQTQPPTMAIDPTLSRPAKEKYDPVLRELVVNKVGVGSVQRQKGETPEVYRLRSQFVGKIIQAKLSEIIQRPEYGRLPNEETKRLILEKTIHSSRMQANQIVLSDEFKAKTQAQQKALYESVLQ